MKRIIVLFFILSEMLSYGQNDRSFSDISGRINAMLNRIQLLDNDTEKTIINDSIISILDTTLIRYASFSYPFSEIERAGKLLSPDKKFRIINWNLSFGNGTYKYFGYIQVPDKKKNTIKLYPLIDNSENINNPDQESLTNENWYGALYYRILKYDYKNETYYALLGWDGNNDFSNKKLIELLYFTHSGKPRFGKNVFTVDNNKMKRVIFEYNNRAILTLRYDEYLKMIVYEHLSPEKPSQVGQYQFYVPDFSYDGLEFKDGKFIHHEAINVHDHNGKYRKEIKDIIKRKKSGAF